MSLRKALSPKYPRNFALTAAVGTVCLAAWLVARSLGPWRSARMAIHKIWIAVATSPSNSRASGS